MIANRLTFDRDALLESDSWSAPAKAYLNAKEKRFDVGPVIESYVNTASWFFNRFVNEINERNAEAKAEFIAAGEEYKEWYEDQMGMNTPGYKALFPDTPPQNRAERRGQRTQPQRSSKRNRKHK